MEDNKVQPEGEQLREKIKQYIVDYKDAVERHALAETPDESTDYLMGLIPPMIDKAVREERERSNKWASTPISDIEAKLQEMQSQKKEE